MRNKKFLALAMAAVVGMTSAPAVYNNVVVAEAAVGDATVKNVSITGGYGTANSGDEAMTGDFELVYTFTNKTQDASTNWFNYGVEVHNGVGGFISTRADNYGWLANDWNTDGSVMSWGDGAESWDDFREVMKDASVKVTVKREGNTVTVANDITGNADSSKKYNFVCTCAMANLPETVYVHLTGEKVDLSDIKAELKAEAEPTVAPTEVPAEPATSPSISTEPAVTEEPTTAPTEAPSEEPTVAPTQEPTTEPTAAPTTEPTETPAPTKKPSAKKAAIVVKNGKKSVSAVSVKAKKSVKLTVSVNSKAKVTAAKLSKKDAKIAKVTLKNNKLTVKGLKKGKVTIKLSAKKTSKYKAATKSLKVTVK